MLLDLLRTFTDFTVLVTRLTVEELTDEQRMALIDQFIHIQGLDTVFDFGFHELLMLLITILIIIFWRAWKRAGRWPHLCFKSRACSRTPQVSPCGPLYEP
jgi:hypothetical protein